VRLLVISDLYPPASLGGYEVAASEVTQALQGRGHDVWVLTTDAGASKAAPTEQRVARALRSRQGTTPSALGLLREGRRQSHDRRAIDRLLAEARPDAVFVWNVGGVSHRVLTRVMNGPAPAVVYVFGDWPLRKFRAAHDLDPWVTVFAPRTEPLWRSAPRSTLAGLARLCGVSTHAERLRFDHLEFGSRFLMDLFHQGGLVAPGSERLIYYGLFGDYARAAGEPAVRRNAPARNLLFVGRLWEAKGIHTIIEALGRLHESGEHGFALTIAGPEEHPDYAAALRRRSDELGVASQVAWAGAVPRDALLPLYRRHDAVIFPSVYDEPFGIVQLEAMAAGCAVIGTATGGSAEIVESEANALVFRAGDAADLARQVARLGAEPTLAQRLREAAKRTVRERFLGERMVNEIEAHLSEIVARGRR
jgi:glycogen(starch) synthase